MKKKSPRRKKLASFHLETRVYHQSLLHGRILKFNANSSPKTLGHQQFFSELIQKRNDFSSVLTYKRCENTWHTEYVRGRLWRNFYWSEKGRENWRFVSASLSVLLSRIRLRLQRSKTVRINCPRTEYLSSSGSFLLRFLEYSSFFSLIS